jgi:hypothetical protein
VIFHPLTLLLLLDYKFPLNHAVFGVEPSLSPLQNSLALVSIYTFLRRVKMGVEDQTQGLMCARKLYHYTFPAFPILILKILRKGCLTVLQ